MNGYLNAQETVAGSVAYVFCNSPYIPTTRSPYICSNTGQWLGNDWCSKFNKTIIFN